jgi:hypothetical protein
MNEPDPPMLVAPDGTHVPANDPRAWERALRGATERIEEAGYHRLWMMRGARVAGLSVQQIAELSSVDELTVRRYTDDCAP